MTIRLIIRNLLLITVSIYIFNVVFAGNENSMLNKQPIVTVRAEITGCVYDIRINDVSVAENKTGNPIKSDFPANHWIKSGENILTLYIRPTGENKSFATSADCTVKLRVRNSSDPIEKIQTMASINFSASSASAGNGTELSPPAGEYSSLHAFTLRTGGDVKVGEVNVEKLPDGIGLKISRSISMPLSLPKWKWFDSDSIEQTDKVKDELTRAMSNIWQLLKTKKIASAPQLFKERVSEYASAFYESEDEMSVFNDMLKAQSNPKVYLFDLELKGAKLEVFGNNRLASLTHEDGDSLISFIFNDNDGAGIFYDLIFRKEGNNWILTR